jgi:hypothetical protein
MSSRACSGDSDCCVRSRRNLSHELARCGSNIHLRKTGGRSDCRQGSVWRDDARAGSAACRLFERERECCGECGRSGSASGSDPSANANSCAHTDAYADTNTESDSDSCTDTNTDSDTNACANTDPNSDARSDTDSNSNSSSYPDSNSNSSSYPDASACCGAGGLLERDGD